MISKVMNKGFTLVELVVGIVVLAIAMVGMNTMLVSQSKDALEPLYRLRASQLGQNIMEDILTRSYDQKSDHSGGYYRCGEIWGDANLWFDGTAWQTAGTPTAVPCTAIIDYGPDGAHSDGGEKPDPINLNEQKHPTFNDVDDFVLTDFISAVNYGDVVGNPLTAQYNNYAVKIAVRADSTSLAGTTMKRIDVTIKTPSDEEIVFSALKGNY
ncbi:MAG: MSHA pilin protein MshD [Psychromonas sp.]|jgi:MSHA pilin protein MshD|uniref:type IV pilus modification PilV family protein n=1 Tax=Psychromonas sp. TaxID=1884585 RepID=UPI0039E5F4ED